MQTNLGDNASGANSTTTTDSHSGTDCDITTNPYVFLDGYRLACLWAFCSVPQVWVKRMIARVEAEVWSDKCSVTDGNHTGVDDGAVGIDKYVSAKLEIGSIINAKWTRRSATHPRR